jgi:hypothetical protein
MFRFVCEEWMYQPCSKSVLPASMGILAKEPDAESCS